MNIMDPNDLNQILISYEISYNKKGITFCLLKMNFCLKKCGVVKP